MKGLKVAFFGTPAFCVPCLEAVFHSQHKVVCVVTQPDKPSGRGKELIQSPAKIFATEHNIPVFQPLKISKEIEGIFAPPAEKPDIIVTCAFGQILRQNVIDFCRYGVVNVHASYLPKYRGACPINMAVLHGEKTTGITIMQTDIGIDTGDIIFRVPVEIRDGETAGELTERLSHMGASALVDVLDKIEKGTAQATPQDHANASYFPMLKKTDGEITLNHGAFDDVKSVFKEHMTAQDCVNHVRGMHPWPCAFVKTNLGDIRIHRAHCENGEFVPDIVQAPNARSMPWRDFLNGRKDFSWKK
jgi:methionyl-tRNA formyltransferase